MRRERPPRVIIDGVRDNGATSDVSVRIWREWHDRPAGWEARIITIESADLERGYNGLFRWDVIAAVRAVRPDGDEIFWEDEV